MWNNSNEVALQWNILKLSLSMVVKEAGGDGLFPLYTLVWRDGGGCYSYPSYS